MKIYIASHKHLELPCDSLYQPLLVGACKIDQEDRLSNWEYDDSYESNISYKNRFYCELTGLHWIWKQSDEDIVGLVHYRRFFESRTAPSQLIQKAEIESILSRADCIVPEQIPCLSPSGCLVSPAEHHRLCHPGTDYRQLSNVIKGLYPSYYDAFIDFSLNEVSLSPYNMIICRKQLLNDYSSWLFTLEEALERRLSPLEDRTPYQQRVYGFLSERLLNVYLLKNKCITHQCPVFDPSNTAAVLSDSKEHWPIRSKRYIGPKPTTVRDGINYASIFDVRFYLSHYPDLYEVYSSCPEQALDHFLTHGLDEGRIAHPRFSIISYINGNPDIWFAVGKNRLKMAQYYIRHRLTARRAIGYESSFYESLAEPPAPHKVTSPEFKREAYLHIAELQGLVD